MTALRATVIMKTDIRGSTVRFRALPEADLGALLTEHRGLVSRLAAAHEGPLSCVSAQRGGWGSNLGASSANE